MNFHRLRLRRARYLPGLAIFAIVGGIGIGADAAMITAAEDGSIRYYVQDWDATANGGLGAPTAYNTAPLATDGRIDDRWAISTGSGVTDNTVGTAGSFGVDRYAAVHEIFFALPARPAGHAVDTASLAAYLVSRNGVPTFNVDVWGMGYKAAATYSTNDYPDVDGDNNPGTGGGLSVHAPQRREILFSDSTDLGAAYGLASRTKVLNDLLTTASALNAYATGSDPALVSYLNAVYDAGAVAGDYVVFRLSPDSNLTPSSANLRYHVGTKESAANNAQAAILSLEFVEVEQEPVVPEPGSLILMTLAGFVVSLRRDGARKLMS